MCTVIKPQENVATDTQRGLLAKFPKGRRNLPHLYLPMGLENCISATGAGWWGPTFVQGALFIQTLLMTHCICVSLSQYSFTLTLPDCILPDNLFHFFENNSLNIRRICGLSRVSHLVYNLERKKKPTYGAHPEGTHSVILTI